MKAIASSGCRPPPADHSRLPTTSQRLRRATAASTTADGLASLRAEHITEDHDGYLWFATDGGVSRFDGSPSQQPHALAEG